MIALTLVGGMATNWRNQGKSTDGKSLGEAAIADFFQNGLQKHVGEGQTALLLFEDVDIRSVKVIRIPPNVHLVSTISWLQGLQDLGIIPSWEAVIHAMMHPTDPAKRPRKFKDFPDGTEISAEIGGSWRPR